MIVRATLRDLRALSALETECFSPPWSDAALGKLLENPAYLVLVERDESASARGYLIGSQVGDEVELARLGVTLEARGQGIGARLVECALAIWRTAGARSVFLEVRERNAVARRLYAAQGFREVGQRANYYENGETALVLRLDLAPC